MFLITETNSNVVAGVAEVEVPVRARSVEVPVVCEAGAVLLTRPKEEARSKSEGFGG